MRSSRPGRKCQSSYMEWGQYGEWITYIISNFVFSIPNIRKTENDVKMVVIFFDKENLLFGDVCTS